MTNLLRAQTSLKAKGFDPGPLDGAGGPRTYQAMAEYITGGKAPEGVGVALEKWLPLAEINTRLRLSHFFAQMAHESSFQPKRENLNYTSAERLMAVWPARFRTRESALPYLNNPEKLANLVYANRYGNGPETSGDGWRYAGKGFVQLTFADNYKRYGFADEPERLLTLDGSAEAACRYWRDKGINAFADLDDCTMVTQRINGATIGFADRQAKTNAMKALWA